MKTRRPPSIAGLLIRCLVLSLSAIASSSCHTTAGLGQDIRHVGQKIETTADRIH